MPWDVVIPLLLIPWVIVLWVLMRREDGRHDIERSWSRATAWHRDETSRARMIKMARMVRP
jgi:hypothetical protein